MSTAKEIYLATRKRHDQLFNSFVMRPIASVVVLAVARTRITPNQLTILSVVVFAAAALLLMFDTEPRGAWLGVAVLELSYLLDCADGMLARHKKLASRQGHLFDFFTDEIKAAMLVSALAIRLYETGGWAPWGTAWPAGSDAYLLAGIGGVFTVASATSLTSFLRRPEISGRETTVEAFYEAAGGPGEGTGLRRAVGVIFTFLRFLGHYPSHVWLFALFGRLDVFFWMYVAIHFAYLGRGWLGLVVRFGKGRDE